MNFLEYQDRDFWNKLTFDLDLNPNQTLYLDKIERIMNQSRVTMRSDFRDTFEIVVKDIQNSTEDPKRIHDLISDVISIYQDSSEKFSLAFCELLGSLTKQQRLQFGNRLKILLK